MRYAARAAPSAPGLSLPLLLAALLALLLLTLAVQLTH